MPWKELKIIGPKAEINEFGDVRREGKMAKAYKMGTPRQWAIFAEENGVRKSYYLARLVAEVFLPHPGGDVRNRIRLIDGDPDNICPENLQWY